MRTDPFQMHDLIGSAAHRDVLAEMRLRHLEYFRSTQVNLAAGYKPMMQRAAEEGGGKQGLAERLYQQYRKIQKLDSGQ
jgi:hypothetical protein